jgi:cell division protein ZapA
MSNVKVNIAGKDYKLACEDGQEQHLELLVKQVDGRAQALMKQVGKLPESMLLVYTALMIADELHDAKKEMRKLVSAMENGADDAKVVALENEMAGHIEAMASRIEQLASRLEAA